MWAMNMFIALVVYLHAVASIVGYVLHILWSEAVCGGRRCVE